MPLPRFLAAGLVRLAASAEEALCSSGVPYVWPRRDWALTELSEEQYGFWERNGYLVVENAVPPDVARRAAAAIREFIGADDASPETWYRNTLDIYTAFEADGRRPLHGPCGMVQMSHHETLWAIRQLPNLHRIFSDLYGTERLFVTADRAHFKPPEDSKYPAWSNPGDVHGGLHWDVNTSKTEWPVPFAVQGVVYLEDTPADSGPLQLVPGFHERFEHFGSTEGDGREATEAGEAIPVPGPAGSLVLWHSLLPHGPGRNVGKRPRISAYVTMLPVDAEPFNGQTERPLMLSDSGTVAFFAVDAEGGRPRRLSREQRVERWRRRLPLLAEDPQEHELPRRPPGEEHGRPTRLTELGEKLVGLREW